MNWAGWGDFWAMGGYGLYVWGSYGAVLLGIAGELWSLRRGSRAARRRLERLNQLD